MPARGQAVKLLLSSPLAPYPHFREGRDSLHVNCANPTFGQGIFAVPTCMHFYGLHLIAQNVHADSTVLEHPTERRFVRELRKKPDVVGITFVLPFFSRVIEMCRLARRHCPTARIVLGGHGVQCFGHATGREEELRGLVDGVCHGDGVRYFRELLGEDPAAPVTQDLPPGVVYPFGNRLLAQYSATLLCSLGCRNACDFCSASAFYGHQRIPLASPQELFEAVKRDVARSRIDSARILDDNFLVDRDYVLEFGRLLRSDPEVRARGFAYSTFADLRTVASYTPEELVRCGLSGVLIGFESRLVDRLAPSIRRKVEGLDAHAIVRGLTDHGICVEGSLILGWDFHDPTNIEQDIDDYVSLGTTFDQIVTLVPVPETRLWRQLQEEGRLLEPISWDDAGFYSRWHRFKNFTHDELWHWEEEALRRTYETWGPSYLRLFEVHLKGHRRLRGHADPYVRARAVANGRACRDMLPLLPAIRLFGPNGHVRAEVDRLQLEYRAELGGRPWPSRLRAVAVTAIAAAASLRTVVRQADTRQPWPEVYHYGGAS